jgi:hypothetical protein
VRFRPSDLKFERLVLIGQRQRKHPPVVLPAERRGGQNHGVERRPYSFLGRDSTGPDHISDRARRPSIGSEFWTVLWAAKNNRDE